MAAKEEEKHIAAQKKEVAYDQAVQRKEQEKARAAEKKRLAHEQAARKKEADKTVKSQHKERESGRSPRQSASDSEEVDKKSTAKHAATKVMSTKTALGKSVGGRKKR